MAFSIQKLRNKSFNFGSILHNQVFLYLVLLLSAINMVVIALQKDLLTPTIFVLVAFITSFFSKNMVVILVIALCASNIIKYGTKIRINEGLEVANITNSLSDATDISETDITDESDPLLKPKVNAPVTSGVSSSIATGKSSQLDPAGVKLAKSTMRDLQNVQKSIAENVKVIEKSISNAEIAVNSMKEGMMIPRIKKP